MEYSFGNLIKVERMRQNMKQSVLARGICSISYLSKIENNQTSPSEKVLELIFERLDLEVPLYFDFSEQVLKIKKEIRGALKNAILSRRDELHLGNIEKYKKNSVVLQSRELYITLMITLARFGMMPGGNVQYFIEVGWIEDQLNSDDKLRYDLLRCLYMFQYQSTERELTIKLLEEIQKKLPMSQIPDWEVADMRYIIGGMYYRFTDYLQAIENVRISLDYFQENYCLERIIESHIIIGLSFKRRNRFNEALDHYKKAEKVASAAQLQGYFGMLYNNMGDIYFMIGDHEIAFNYFLDSFSVKEDVKSKLYSVMSLIEVNESRGNNLGIIEWLNIGSQLIDKEDGLEEFIYHFDIYRNKYHKINQTELLNSLKKAVHYFEAYDEYYTHKYSLWLSRELKKSGKYKLATEYYEKTISMMSR